MEPFHYIRSSALVAPLEFLQLRAGSRARKRVESELPGDLPSNTEARVGIGTYLEVLDRSAHLAGDTHFLLQVGRMVPIESFGIAGQAILNSRTLLDALVTTKDILHYFQSGSVLDISMRNGRCRVLYGQDFDAAGDSSKDVHLTMGFLANVVGRVQHANDPGTIIYYPYAKSEHLKYLPSTAKVVSSNDGIIEFDDRALQSPMPQANSERSEVLRHFMALKSIDAASDLNMSELVAQLIRSSMGVVRPSQSEIAAILGMNVRALHRELQVEQTNFRKVLERTSLAVALEDLAEGKSVTETAMKLGYDHPQNFTTAFQRWSGRAPSSV